MIDFDKAPSHHSDVWALTDDRPGNVNQVLGITEALGMNFETKQIRYTPLARIPNVLKPSLLTGFDPHRSDLLEAPWPQWVVSAGRKSAMVALWIKRQSLGSTRVLQLMSPGAKAKAFDLIVLPEHDKPHIASNIITSIGAPNRITPSLLNQHGKDWSSAFSHLPKPFIGLLIGGDTKKGAFSPAHMEQLVSEANNIAQQKNGSLLITSSRRTSPQCIQILKQSLAVPHYLHEFSQLNKNPYLGILGLSDMIIATGDSISMCSESCTTGKPVFIYAPPSCTPKKHANFHSNLYDHENAKPLLDYHYQWQPQPLNEALRISGLIKNQSRKN